MNHPEQEILDRITQARAPVESVDQPQDEPEPTEDVAEATEVIEASDADVTESDEYEDEPVSDVDESEELYLQLDDREIPLSEIKEWEQGHLRQADYTRKTQELAEQRKAFEQEQSAIKAKAEKLDQLVVELEAQLGEEEQIDWDELRDYDPSAYLKKKEEIEAKKAALMKAKQERQQETQQQTQAQAQAELQRLVSLNPQWIDNGKETESYHNDMNMVRDYLSDVLQLTEEQQAGILLSGHGQAYIDAAKYHKGSKTNAAVKKKVKKAPVVTKPGGNNVSPKTEAIRRAEAAHKKYGTVETAYALRKAKSNAA